MLHLRTIINEEHRLSIYAPSQTKRKRTRGMKIQRNKTNENKHGSKHNSSAATKKPASHKTFTFPYVTARYTHVAATASVTAVNQVAAKIAQLLDIGECNFIVLHGLQVLQCFM